MQLDRFGRRVLLFWSATFVTISLAAMGTFFFFQLKWGATEASSLLGWLPLVALIIFFIAFSSGLANVPFVIMGELFPSRYRFILGPISSSFNLLCIHRRPLFSYYASICNGQTRNLLVLHVLHFSEYHLHILFTARNKRKDAGGY